MLSILDGFNGIFSRRSKLLLTMVVVTGEIVATRRLLRQARLQKVEAIFDGVFRRELKKIQ